MRPAPPWVRAALRRHAPGQHRPRGASAMSGTSHEEIPHPGSPTPGAWPTAWSMYLSEQEVVGVGEVDAAGGDVEQLLTLPGDGVGQVDDVRDLGAAEAADLHSAHAGEAEPAARDLLPGLTTRAPAPCPERGRRQACSRRDTGGQPGWPGSRRSRHRSAEALASCASSAPSRSIAELLWRRLFLSHVEATGPPERVICTARRGGAGQRRPRTSRNVSGVRASPSPLETDGHSSDQRQSPHPASLPGGAVPAPFR